jgi:hypothetical protein
MEYVVERMKKSRSVQLSEKVLRINGVGYMVDNLERKKIYERSE